MSLNKKKTQHIVPSNEKIESPNLSDIHIFKEPLTSY